MRLLLMSECLAADVLRAAAKKQGQFAALELLGYSAAHASTRGCGRAQVAILGALSETGSMLGAFLLAA